MKIFICTLCTLISLNSFARGQERGNGGVGFEIDNRLYLLDLVESRVHQNPYLNLNLKPNADVVEEISLHIAVSEEVAKLVAIKLLEVYEKSPFTEYLLRKALFDLEWRYIPHSLLDLNDHSDDVLDLSSLEGRTQLAVRIEKVVSFSLENFDKLNDENKAALIIHEVIYTIISYQNLERDRTPPGFIKDVAYSVRYLTGFLFSKKMKITRENSFISILVKNKLNTRNTSLIYKDKKFKSFLVDKNQFQQKMHNLVISEEIETKRNTYCSSEYEFSQYKFSWTFYERKSFSSKNCEVFLNDVEDGNNNYTFYDSEFLFLNY